MKHMRPSERRRRGQLLRGQHGYVLLTLLLMVALLVIAASAAMPYIAFEIRRDREEEMIHRGVQYSRAIRSYYKKFGRYPTRIEELESTNNMRFLRKRYKDPITGQDFKLLHFGEVKLTFSAPVVGASGINGASSLNSPGGFGAQPSASPFGGPGPTGMAPTRSAPPDNASAAADQNQPANANSTSKPESAESSQASGSSSASSGGNSGDQLSGQTFGGGPVVGVVSISKKESIREFNHKRKYNEWQFIYDPATDRGGLLSTPNQPPLQGFANNQQAPPGQPANQNGNGFGMPGGIQNNPNPTGPGVGPITPVPPTTNPPDQQ